MRLIFLIRLSPMAEYGRGISLLLFTNDNLKFHLRVKRQVWYFVVIVAFSLKLFHFPNMHLRAVLDALVSEALAYRTFTFIYDIIALLLPNDILVLLMSNSHTLFWILGIDRSFYVAIFLFHNCRLSSYSLYDLSLIISLRLLCNCCIQVPFRLLIFFSLI